MRPALLIATFLVAGCNATPPMPETRSCEVEMTLMNERDAALACANLSDDARSSACVIRDVRGGKTHCQIIAPAPASLDAKTNIYYIGAALYKCCVAVGR